MVIAYAIVYKDSVEASTVVSVTYSGVVGLGVGLIAFAIAAVIRLMIDVVMTLREIRDK